MHALEFLYPALLTLSAFTGETEAARGSGATNSVLLSNVKTLTLRKDLRTSHRRVSAIPQLRCVGGNAKDLYDIDVLRCKNQGADYDDENIQWTCTAALPEEFKLGATDVICEGYDSPEDPYILKGSCGVEYRLLLTEKGEEKYGKGGGDLWRDYKGKGYINWPAIIFWGIFLSVVGWMIYSAFFRDGGGLPRGGGGGGWGGWGGGGGGGDDPPPPYDWQPPRKSTTSTRRAGAAPAAGQAGWRPGFWTGVLGGGAAGYLAGNRGQTQQPRTPGWGGQQTGGFWGDNGGEGSSRSGSHGSSGSSFSSTRYESTGFGSTNRR